MEADDARQEAREIRQADVIERHGLGLVSDGADEIVAELFGCETQRLHHLLQCSELAEQVHEALETWPEDADQYEGLLEAAGDFIRATTKAGRWTAETWMAARLAVVEEMEMTARRSIHGWPT